MSDSTFLDIGGISNRRSADIGSDVCFDKEKEMLSVLNVNEEPVGNRFLSVLELAAFDLSISDESGSNEEAVTDIQEGILDSQSFCVAKTTFFPILIQSEAHTVDMDIDLSHLQQTAEMQNVLSNGLALKNNTYVNDHGMKVLSEFEDINAEEFSVLTMRADSEFDSHANIINSILPEYERPWEDKFQVLDITSLDLMTQGAEQSFDRYDSSLWSRCRLLAQGSTSDSLLTATNEQMTSLNKQWQTALLSYSNGRFQVEIESDVLGKFQIDATMASQRVSISIKTKELSAYHFFLSHHGDNQFDQVDTDFRPTDYTVSMMEGHDIAGQSQHDAEEKKNHNVIFLLNNQQLPNEADREVVLSPVSTKGVHRVDLYV